MELSHSDKKSINELYGIIKGIDADNIINQEEIKFLQEWLINNKNYENSESIGGIETTQIYTHLHNESLMNAMQGHPMSKFKINDALAYNY